MRLSVEAPSRRYGVRRRWTVTKAPTVKRIPDQADDDHRWFVPRWRESHEVADQAADADHEPEAAEHRCPSTYAHELTHPGLRPAGCGPAEGAVPVPGQ
jgi:hypothetical protein